MADNNGDDDDIGATQFRFKKRKVVGSNSDNNNNNILLPPPPTTFKPLLPNTPAAAPPPLIHLPKKSKFDNENIKRLKEEVNINKSSVDTLPELFAQNVTLTTFSPEDIIANGVVEIISSDQRGPGTVLDPQMGAIDHAQICPTCRKDSIGCTGHYGYIKLNQAIINPLAIRTIIRVLRCVCNSDGRLLVPVEKLKRDGILGMQGMNKLMAIERIADGYKCSSRNGEDCKCKANPHFDIAKSDETNTICYTQNKKKPGKHAEIMSYTTEDLIIILDRISAATCKLLGFQNGASPKNFVLSVLPVIPTCARLPTDQDSKMWDDDLTKMYRLIVKINNAVGAFDKAQQQQDVATIATRRVLQQRDGEERKKMVNNLTVEVKNLLIEHEKSIKSRIQGKTALIRNSMMGKRVNFSGRTVISPDPSLKFGQARIPHRIARTITKPEIVYARNRKQLTSLLRAGRVNHIVPGSATAGKYKGLKLAVNPERQKNYVLQDGDVVHRWIHNGDYVVINRQPTLSKESWLGVECVIAQPEFEKKDNITIPTSGPNTLGLHMGYTTPQNADFDGDEMNIHVPQSIAAEAEVRELMGVKECIMSGQNNQNVMGVVFNAPTAAGLLTEDGVYIDTDLLYDCIELLTWNFDMESWKTRLEMYNVSILSGKALFSILLPEDFFYMKGKVVIKNGILIKGPIDKDHIGPTSRSIVQNIWHQYGSERAALFMTDGNFVLDKYFSNRGFSIGKMDCDSNNPAVKKKVNEEIEKARLIIRSMGEEIDDPIEMERRESIISTAVSNVKNIVGKEIVDATNNTVNSLAQMIKYKSKGKVMNLTEMTGVIGQQFLGGKRLETGLAYYDKDDPDYALESRGFIKNSYMNGMNPAELFYLQTAGREGLIDTALNTADSGSIHHKVIKATEDISVWWDGSVRNTFGTVFQFVYGGDNFDPSRLIKVQARGQQVLSYVNMKDEVSKLNAKYGY